MSQPVKLLFASCSDDLIPKAIEQMRTILPETPLVVVSEFAPPGRLRWIPFHVGRTFEQNLALCRSKLSTERIAFAAIVLEPRTPFDGMRWMAFRLAPLRLFAFNENLDHFRLHPVGLPQIVRHFAWRFRNLIRWQLQPGGDLYTFLWRLGHPAEFRRPMLVRRARAFARRWQRPAAPALESGNRGEPGISVVIPSRNGRELLGRLLPGVLADLAGPCEVIVVDNGSDDGTQQWLRAKFPAVTVELSESPLSFAKAVNRGIQSARFQRVCLLNNDMVIEPGFFAALDRAFAAVPDLFCATAQIFFPAGQRREETGKAVLRSSCPADESPLWCDEPIDGEDHSPVLYGSGGCSLYDASKLLAMGGFDEAYEPAYCEDLDLGFRAWQGGWPTVFVAGARVEHRHRATTSRYFQEDELRRVLELNYLRFLARALADPPVFERLWTSAVQRLNLLSARPGGRTLLEVIENLPEKLLPLPPRPAARIPDAMVLAFGAGDIAVFPGRKASGRPVIAVASPYLPFPLSHGGAVRIFNLISRASQEFDMALVCFVDALAPVPPELLEICAEVVLVRRAGSHTRPLSERPDTVDEFDVLAFRGALQQTVRKWKPAVVQLEFTQMAVYADACAPAKTVLVEHDITYDLYAQMLRQGSDWEVEQQHERWVRFERLAWKSVDAVVVMSEKDRKLIEGAPAVVLANGVDVERFRPSEAEPEAGRLLFIGSFAHLPNALALEWFLRKVWPRVEARGGKLHVIAGSRPEYFLDRYRDRVRLDLTGIELDAFVSDVRPAYRRASVVIAPLLASAGTNIKIMEAMAMGRAIVATDGGVHGLDVTPGEDFLLANTGDEFAEAVEVLLADPTKRKAIEQRARTTAVAKYDWDAIAALQREFYDSLRAKMA